MPLELFAYKLDERGDQNDAVVFLKLLASKKLFALNRLFAKLFAKIYPGNSTIKNELAFSSFHENNHYESFDKYREMITLGNLTDEQVQALSKGCHTLIPAVRDRYSYYDVDKVQKIMQRKRSLFPIVTFSITTCKRFDLFERTMNTFINCCEDLHLIDKWICVDDNSSSEDRLKMVGLYPFFTFHFKGSDEKGHPKSMNIIQREVKTPYLLHIEDDWEFFIKRPYITDCLSVFESNERIAQCLFNKNYGETENQLDIVGGEFHRALNGLPYYLHEFCPNNEARAKFEEKWGKNVKNCAYWPHFSFRPSLINTMIFQTLGKFDEQAPHFEMDYAHKFASAKFISAFLETVHCLHIGRLTTERHDKTKPNAYVLNNQSQFINEEEEDKNEEERDIKPFDIKVKTYVVNLDRREDRWDQFTNNDSSVSFLNYERFSAVDGKNLKWSRQLGRIFEENDYNWRRGLIGCALSHIKLWIELLNSEYDAFLVLEDDVDFVPDFERKLYHAYNEIKETDWDLLYLGHHLYKRYVTEQTYDKENYPTCEKWNRLISITRSMGGTVGYLINKKGALGLLNFINEKGMTNGIDTVQQKSADGLNIYYAKPHLVYSECFTGDNKDTVDTDIQFDFESLKRSIETRLYDEHHFWEERGADPFVTDIYLENPERVFIFNTEDVESYKERIEKLEKLEKLEKHRHYRIGRSYVIVPEEILTDEIRENIYFQRLKKFNPESGKEEWDITDTLITT
jgi:GR25 family glycosyltransferase involved in LPS biosynthesis